MTCLPFWYLWIVFEGCGSASSSTCGTPSAAAWAAAESPAGPEPMMQTFSQRNSVRSWCEFSMALSNHGGAQSGEARMKFRGTVLLVVAHRPVQPVERRVGGAHVAQLRALREEIEEAPDRHRRLLGPGVVAVFAREAVLDQAGKHRAQVRGLETAGSDATRQGVER